MNQALPKYLFQFNLYILFLVFANLSSSYVTAQNSLLGDGFGGRSWYSSYNLSVGSYSAYTVCGDENQLYAWGSNWTGQLGDGTLTNTSKPVKVIGVDSVSFYTAGYMSAAIKEDGSLWVWGALAGSLPKKIDDDVYFVDAGIKSVTYVKKDGSVWSYGADFGNFGHGSTKTYPTDIPINMLGVKDAVRVAVSGEATAVLTKNGEVFTVGKNEYGELGMDSSINNLVICEKITNLKNIVDIKSTTRSFAALTSTGEVYFWGLGHRRTVYTPWKISSLKDVIAISGKTDGGHFLFLDEKGQCFAKGGSLSGASGGGRYWVSDEEPVLVASKVVEILAGETFSYIIKRDGSLWATGKSLGKNASIWMNLKDTLRWDYTKINEELMPMQLCPNKKKYSAAKELFFCYGDSLVINGRAYKTPGYFRDTMYNGTRQTLNYYLLNVLPSTIDTIYHTLCQNDSIKLYDDFVKVDTIVEKVYINQFGCDSIIVNVVKIPPVPQDTMYGSICYGDSIKLDGVYRKHSGSYSFKVPDDKTCFRDITYVLEVLPRIYSSVLMYVCEGDSVFSGTRFYSEKGKYFELFKNESGCDSIAEINVNYLPSHQSFRAYTICNTDSIQVGFNWYFETGRYLDTLTNQYGCDSIVETNIDTFHDLTCFKPIVWVPNAFTPNGEEPNNVFRATTDGWQQTTLMIFNRWGEKVFEQTGQQPSWDGTYNDVPCESEAYFYVMKLVNKDIRPEIKNLYGTFLLIR